MKKSIEILVIVLLFTGALYGAYTVFSKPIYGNSAVPDKEKIEDIKQIVTQVQTQGAIQKNTTHTTMSHAIIQTNKGVIEVSLRSETPLATENFKKLAESGFYNGVRFHRVIQGFMIQAGDPQSKDRNLMALWGTGGPGYTFADELTGKETYTQGTLAMANAGPNTNGSQFFIVTASPGVGLPPSYTVFGEVVRGMDVALLIEKVKTGAGDRPEEDVIIETITIK